MLRWCSGAAASVGRGPPLETSPYLLCIQCCLASVAGCGMAQAQDNPRRRGGSRRSVRGRRLGVTVLELA